MKLLLVIPVFLVGVLLVAAPARSSGEVQVGSSAPELRVNDLSGKPVEWSGIDRKSTILYFHSSRTSNAAKALDRLVKELKKDPRICGDTAIVVVVDDLNGGSKASQALQDTGCKIRVAFAPDDAPHARYDVIAFPSVFVLDADKTVVSIVKGYGTLFGFEVVAGARFAAGHIDAKVYAELLSGNGSGAGHPDPHTNRVLQLARKLIAKGNLDMARSALEDLAGTDQGSRPTGILLVQVLLKQGDLEAAASRIARLEADREEDPEVSVLAARLAFRQGDLEAVETRLKILDPHAPGVRHVRGLIHESRGEWKEAAAAYRDAVEVLLLEAH